VRFFPIVTIAIIMNCVCYIHKSFDKNSYHGMLICGVISYIIIRLGVHQLITTFTVWVTLFITEVPTIDDRSFQNLIDKVSKTLQVLPKLHHTTNFKEKCLNLVIFSIYSYDCCYLSTALENEFHALVLLYIMFNGQGKWNTLSSCFKHPSAKVTISILIMIFGQTEVYNQYTRLLPIFLFETNRKFGNYTHMFFVFVAMLKHPCHHVTSVKIIGAFLFFVGDQCCKRREAQYLQIIQSKVKSTEDDEYVVVDNIKIYYNISHYMVHNCFSSNVLLCEMILI